MRKHTPGTWEYRPSQSRQVVSDTGDTICKIHRGKKAQFNGPLITTAPKMLNTLEYLLTRLEDIEDIRIAQEVIAEAKGER